MTEAGCAVDPARRRNRVLASIAAAAAATISALVVGWPQAAFVMVLAALALAVVVADLERMIIPDSANVAILAVGLAFVAVDAGGPVAIGDALARSLAAGGTLYALRFVYRLSTGVTGLGLGDVKLAAASAPWLAWQTLPFALVLASCAAILAVAVEAMRSGRSPDRHADIPFGAFLAPAVWLALILERSGLI